MPSVPPPETMSAANEVLGRSLQLVRPFTHRRGTSVFKLSDGASSRYALKVAKDEAEDTPYSPSACLKREAFFLQEIPEFCNKAYIGEGQWKDGYWLLKDWIDGTLIHRLAIDIRRDFDGNECERKLAELFVKLIEKFAALHAKGYLHGDIQPNHLLMTSSSEICILDWALARTIKEQKPPYRGAFLHYAAPEVAKGMRDKVPEIEYGIAQEIFSVGATLFCLYTDWTITGLAPRAEHPGKDALFDRLINKGPITLQETDAKPFAALEDVFKGCLAPPPDDRVKSLEEACAPLKALIG